MAEREIVQTDAVCKQVFFMLEAFPRFKDQVIDPMIQASDAERGAAETPSRGALLLRGPAKMLQTVTMVTMKGNAPSTAARFKPLA